MKVLFIVPYAPTRIRTRPFHLIKALTTNGHDVTVATLSTGPADDAALAELQAHVHRVASRPISRLRSAWNCVRAFPSGEPLQAHFSWHPELARDLVALTDTQVFDVVHVEHLRGVRYGLRVASAVTASGAGRPPVVWDSVDCISDLFRHAAAQGRSPRVRLAARLELPRTERYESAMAQAFPRVLATSESDRQGLVRLVSEHSGAQASQAVAQRIVVVPNGVDLEHFVPSDAPRETATLVMSGKMSYHANVAAVVRFAEDVLPRIQAQRPDVQLLVVGKDPAPEVLRLGGQRGITVTGTVPDVRPYLQRAALAVAPIQYGVGIQNKVLEAMACGTPVVATPTAVEALGAIPGRELAVARNAEETAEVVLDLLTAGETRKAMGCAARRYVEQHHAWPAIAQRLAQVYVEAAA